jgi:hypothetical protein
MDEVTRILSAMERGDPQAAAQLLPLVYDELRKLAGFPLAHALRRFRACHPEFGLFEPC